MSILKTLFSQFRTRKSPPQHPDSSGNWIGVDLDGTLAHYDGWKGHFHIGDPVQPMLERVQRWIDEGKEVRIFTARASVKEHSKFVELWLSQHGLEGLQVTNQKDYGMIELWDDRCIQIASNSGQPVTDRHPKP